MQAKGGPKTGVRIREELNPINIFDVGDESKEGIQNIDTDMLQKHFILLIIGKPGSGKTTIMKSLLCDPNFYHRKFDKVLLLSPSAYKTDLCIHKNNVNQSFSLPWVYQQINKVNAERKQLPDKVLEILDPYNMLIIFDDFVSEIKDLERNPKLTALFFNRRHLIHKGIISIIVISQKYTMIPARIRSVASWVMAFRLNPNDFLKLWEELTHISKDEFAAILNYIFPKLNFHPGKRKGPKSRSKQREEIEMEEARQLALTGYAEELKQQTLNHLWQYPGRDEVTNPIRQDARAHMKEDTLKSENQGDAQKKSASGRHSFLNLWTTDGIYFNGFNRLVI